MGYEHIVLRKKDPDVPVKKEPAPYSPESWAARMSRAVRDLCFAVNEEGNRGPTPDVKQLIAEAESLIRRWIDSAPPGFRHALVCRRCGRPSYHFTLSDKWPLCKCEGEEKP